MSQTKTKGRAPAMEPEERRKMIVRAALPLVVGHGVAVTITQIARAAGIGEALSKSARCFCLCCSPDPEMMARRARMLKRWSMCSRTGR